jgi:hypothetical protein
MPWQWVPNTRRRRRRNSRRYRRAYDNTYDRSYNAGNGSYDDGGPDSFDGFYDRRGRRVDLVIQTPSDMLPPTRQANMFDENGRPYRTRARF